MSKVGKKAGIIIIEIVASIVGGVIARAVYEEFKRRKYCTSKGYNNFEDNNDDGFLDEDDIDFDAYDIDLDPDHLFLDEDGDDLSEDNISDDFFDDGDDLENSFKNKNITVEGTCFDDGFSDFFDDSDDDSVDFDSDSFSEDFG